MTNNFYEDLKAAMANKTKDELLEQWEKSKEFDSIGPTVTEFVKNSRKVPVKRGCPNKQCFCTGKCEEIVGYRDKLPWEF